jgi:serine/threonine-protein kinase
MFPVEETPETIGSYRIVRRMPSTGPAVVFLATREGPHGLSREVELKLLPDTTDGNHEMAEDLAREAAICGRLNNPVVVRVFDFFEHEGKLVLVMEHVQGVPLSELIDRLAERRQKLGDAAVYHVGARIAGAIADAHGATDEDGQPTPIVHRNLTPENVLISVEGEVRLGGFGVGKILGRTPDTAIGRIKGTPGFMAPEQARGEPVTPKADVYGIGLLLWSLLAGRRPPTDGTWPRRISGLRTDLPKEVAAVVDAALDHFPGTRRISAKEIAQWLDKAGPAAKGKAELRDKVASLRASADGAEEPPASTHAPASTGNPFQGVRFGSPGDPHTRPVARRHTETGEPPRTASSAANPRVQLPPPPPPDAPDAPRFGAPPVESPSALLKRATLRFGAPPLASEPPPEPAEISSDALETVPPPPPDPTGQVPRGSIPEAAAPLTYAQLPARAMLPKSSLLGMISPLAAGIVLPPVEPDPGLTPPPPPAPPRPASRRPPALGAGSTALTIGISAVTAMIVAAGLYAVLHRQGAAPAASASASAGSVPAPPPPPPPVSATAPPPPPTATADAGSVNPVELPFGYGYLTVSSPANATVYVSGKRAGPVNQPLKVRCGRWFVRLAASGEGRYPEWVSGGETVVVGCQAMTRVEMGPRP